jgi:Ser/Thr protein kinase RdoA (MazF antagonist)
VDDSLEIRRRVLPHYEGWQRAEIAPLGNGLINRTYLLSLPDGRARAVLQRVSPIFSPAIHDNILAVTRRLADAGLATPLLLPTRDGAPCLQLAAPPDHDEISTSATSAGVSPALRSVWRLLSHVEGVSFDVVGGAAQAAAAGALIARFHAALDGLAHSFVGARLGVHDTPAHLARLDRAVTDHPGHRLASPVGALAAAIRAGAAALPGLPELPPRICHGDLKFNNILFAGGEPPEDQRPICLVDLDVVGPQPLAFELGDAWRSWCNRAGEDDPEAALDLEIFAASLDGYVAGIRRRLDPPERRALLLGVEWISLELAARFAADALGESYFGWDAARFPGRGEHNLVRARGQWSMHQALVATRDRRAALLDRARGAR